MSDAANKVSVSVHFAKAILKHCLEAGIDTQALLRGQRIPPRLLHEPQARISVQQVADLQTSAMQALGDESLGYANRAVPLGTWDMMCHAVITAQTLGQALHRYCRFFELMGGGMQLELSLEGDAAKVKLASHASAHGAYFSELCLLNTHRFTCWLVQEELPLREVHFQHPPSTRAADYRLMFMGNPVSFEQEDACLIFGASLLEKPVMQTPESLRRYLIHPVLTMLTTSYDFSWTARVRAQLRQNLLFMPELTDVAAALELHPQTLRRRLAAEGNTFKQIKSDIRRDTALHFLGKRALSVEEVAHRAGFSEASAFIRAFKGWTGLTPYAYRKGL
ncbi:AraC family transcriptional regulator [Congregibacter brevis]|uniref:AraC family transcriptional regulator n=1 Tax=Congregibacter brevis TaxID=3081201 RepID=A0ABZ0IAP6_9GAMM|nr:AraC family transcriptional regulator [Congregibacter sp. IMCC45268]